MWKDQANVGSSLLRNTDITPKIIQKIRMTTGRAPPVFRPSLREIVQPGEIEIAVVAAAVKHLKLDIDEKSLKRENSENFVTVSKV